MKIHGLNRWDIIPVEASVIQKQLAAMVQGGRLSAPSTVLGLDVSYRRQEGAFTAAAVLMTLPDMETAGTWQHAGSTAFPYVPGLLSFREVPPLLPILEEIERPDLILVDGHGIAHPRGLGLASHIGLLTRVPTVGCAKRLLTGNCREPGPAAGAAAPITLDGAEVGFALRSRESCRPIYVSPGHLLDPPEALKAVLMCLAGYRLPEPTRLADKLSRGQFPGR